MEELKWSQLKSQRLKRARGVSFEEIIGAKLIAVKNNPKKTHQQLMLFEHKRYIWIVPFIDAGDCLFLKTLYPSRKYTKLYRKGRIHEKD